MKMNSQEARKAIDKAIADAYITSSCEGMTNAMLLDCITMVTTYGKAMPKQMLPFFEGEAKARGLLEDWSLSDIAPDAEQEGTLDALDIPTEIDLAYLDEQAEVMAQQFAGKAQVLQFPERKRMVRIVVFVNGQDVDGQWEVYDAARVNALVRLFNKLSIGYSVQHKEVVA